MGPKKATVNGSSAFSGSEISMVHEDVEKPITTECCSITDRSSDVLRAKEKSTPKRKRAGSESMEDCPLDHPSTMKTPEKWNSPRRALSSGRSVNHGVVTSTNQNGNAKAICKQSDIRLTRSPKSPQKRLVYLFPQKSKWNPRDSSHIQSAKAALHVSTAPSDIICREEEQKRVFEFCKTCIEQEKAGSLYVCGCPGTGKSLTMEKVKELSVGWAKEVGFPAPDLLAINCTSLTNSSEIFSKIHEKCRGRKKVNGICSPLQHLQNLFSRKKLSGRKMLLMIVDEMDYLITKDRSVLHDLFMLTTFPFSQCILIGIANAIDLADRFLPKLQALNCKPMVVNFRAYAKDQILRILQQRLMVLPYDVFQMQGLELCARKVAAASGDMRKALNVCRGAVEILEAELRDSTTKLNLFTLENGLSEQPLSLASECLPEQEISIVRIDHMANALSKTFRSAIVDTIQSLPHHQQMILCSAVKLFRRGKKDTTVGELNKSYTDNCKSALIHSASMLEFTNMCRVLGDQGLLKLGQSREDKLRRVTLKADEADITFALQELPSIALVLGARRAVVSILDSISATVYGGLFFLYHRRKSALIRRVSEPTTHDEKNFGPLN